MIQLLQVGAHVVPLHFVRHHKARRYILRMQPDGSLRATIPRAGSTKEARAFAERNLDWVARQIPPNPQPMRPGVEPSQWRLAHTELTRRTRELAALHNVSIQRITIRNQRTRWGSCSRQGNISLNWRLIQTPDFVRDYIILHELMHRREPNHSKNYWLHVAAVCPDYKNAEAWLKQHRSMMR